VTRRKTPTTLDEHRQLGLALAGMRDELMRISVWLANGHLPKAHPVVRHLNAAYNRIDEARCDLENEMYDHHDGQPGVSTDIYYPDKEQRAGQQQERPRSHADIARRTWPDHAWITGEGPYATVSFCKNYDPPPEPGDHTTTVMLHATMDLALQAIDLIDRMGCGGGCTRDHRLFMIFLEDGSVSVIDTRPRARLGKPHETCR